MDCGSSMLMGDILSGRSMLRYTTFPLGLEGTDKVRIDRRK